MLGSNKVRTVAMSSTDGLRRGMKVVNTNEPIKIPVGKAILGRILNVIGELLIMKVKLKPIHICLFTESLQNL